MAMMACARVSCYTTTSRDYVDRDLYVASAQQNTNFGASIEMQVGYNRRSDAYIHFTLANEPADYQSARLYFYVGKASTSDFSIYFSLVRSNDWNEYDITYSNMSFAMQPGWTSPDEVYVMQNTTGWYSIDLGAFLRWEDTGSELSLCMHNSDLWDYVCIWTREHGDGDRAYIEYTVENEDVNSELFGISAICVASLVMVICVLAMCHKGKVTEKGKITEVLYRKP